MSSRAFARIRSVFVNADDPPDEAEEWLRARGCDFETYSLSERGTKESPLRVKPTTWLLMDGAIVFRVEGASNPLWLANEYRWRVDYLLNRRRR